MKEKEEIIKRAICLLLFADKCALEEHVFDGIVRSLKERENQRNIIIKWAKEKEYYNCFTEKEKRIIETPVIKKTNMEARLCHYDYECIEPLLWSLGIVRSLHNYDEFVLDNLHTPLQIGPNHSLESISKICNCRSCDEIEKSREIAMLWYWRCLECRNASTKKVGYKKAIGDIFGGGIVKILESYKYFDNEKDDFVVRGKTVTELDDFAISKLEILAERRFYTFEWLCTDAEWDSVDLVC